MLESPALETVGEGTARDAFVERMLQIVNDAALALMLSIGHRTRLFDVMATRPGWSAVDLAEAAGLSERYVREWLAALVTGAIVEFDGRTQRYSLPPDRAACLTRTASPNNLAVSMQWIAVLGTAEDAVVEAFSHGRGVPYSAYPRFHEVMAEESQQTVVQALTPHILPLVPDLVDRLTTGVGALDIACGSGRAVLALARSFPRSHFTGIDMSAEAIAAAEDEAARLGLANARFIRGDAAELAAVNQYELITAFDAIHDQARPALVLERIHGALRPGGVLLMQDILGHTHLVVGGGPIDLVFVMGWVSHLEYFGTEPSFARFLTRLASFSRLILIDKRGTGLSDRAPELPTLEQRMDDLRAVMDEVGSEQAALVGVSEGGPMSALFAATYPEKTRALVMIGTYAKRLWDPEYPWAPTREQREAFYDQIRDGWGGPIGLEERAPSMAADPAFRAWWSTYLRMGASPGAALALTQMNAEIDIRDILPLVRVPTLVLHRTDDRCLKVEEGRYVASRIPGARFVELPGQDHLPFVGDQDTLLGEIERFIIEAPMLSPFDRVLSTIVHVRIGGPVDPAAFLDHAWREADWFRGRTLESSPERFVAAFDGPARAVRCATALVAASDRFGIGVYAGLHTGECEMQAGRPAGTPVDLAAAIATYAAPGEVLVSRTVRDIVGDAGLPFEDAGAFRIGTDEEFRLFRAWRG